MRPAFLILICAVCPVWGQIAQSHPEYCGIPGEVNPPLPDISAAIDPSDEHVVLRIGRGNSASAVALPGYWIAEISEVCPLSDGRLVVFANFGGTDVTIVDVAKAAVVDHFDPASMSPDERWIVYVKFWPLHGSEGSEEYLLYDLTESPVRNRADTREGANSTDPGRLIFPPGHENFPGSNINLPKDQQHFGGRRLYWAADSRAVLLEDRAASGPGIVLVTLDEKGATSAFRHPLTQVEVCGRDVPSGVPLTWSLDRAEIGPDTAGGRSTFLSLRSAGDPRCAPHLLQLNEDDFQAAGTEVNVRPTYTRGQVRNGKEVIPPPRKDQ
ncbi:MAG: hypothetical protein ABSF25_00290 [Bryobacteraceae bacterium]|jgi:hypothetical protein